MERDTKSFRWSFDYYISYNFFLMLSFILVFMTIIVQKQNLNTFLEDIFEAFWEFG